MYHVNNKPVSPNYKFSSKVIRDFVWDYNVPAQILDQMISWGAEQVRIRPEYYSDPLTGEFSLNNLARDLEDKFGEDIDVDLEFYDELAFAIADQLGIV